MGCLLLNDIEISISITFTENLNFFCSHLPSVKPKIMIDEVTLIPQLCLLREHLMTSINRRLLSTNLQIPYFTWVTKIHTVQVGMLDAYLDVTLRDMETDLIYAIFIHNENLLGKPNQNIHRYFSFLVACYATLHPALSVRPSVGPSVTLYFFWVFGIFGFTAPAQMIW